MRLLWLAEDCRRAGLKVVEVPGWETRGADFPAFPNTVVAHHTATPATARGDLPTKKILLDGRPDLPGPLCQVGLGRNGTVYVIASGKANHAGKGAWKGTTSSAQTIGIEAEHPGPGAWPAEQYAAYVKLTAVLLRGLGQNAERACAHREWALPAGRKTDVAFDMAPFRAAVRQHLDALNGTPAPTEGDDVALSDDDVEKVARKVVELLKPIVATHDDMVVLLRGTKAGTHPNNLTSIGKAVGVPQ
jgi:hypothetical protein